MSNLGRNRYIFGSAEYYSEVATFANLPSAAGHVGRVFIVTTGSWSGLWYHRPGLYRSDGSSWSRLGALTTVSDEKFALYDEGGSQNQVAMFECSTIAAATTRVFTFPNASGTLALQSWVSGAYLAVANNLSDVADVATARTNLGLGTTDSPTFADLTISGNVAIGMTSPSYILQLEEDNTSSMAIYLDNVNEASAVAHCFVSVHTKENGGDPQIGWGIKNSGGASIGHSWHMGIDNSDSDKFKLAQGTIGSDDTFEITLEGAWSLFTDGVTSGNAFEIVDTTKDTPVVADNSRTIAIWADGAAYFKGRDVTHMSGETPDPIEFLMGTSVAGEVLLGSMTAHDLSIRTANTRRVKIINSTGEVRILNDLKVGADSAPSVALDVTGAGKFSTNLTVTGTSSLGTTKLQADNRKLFFGAADDASIYYDGADFYVNPKEVGTGWFRIAGTLGIPNGEKIRLEEDGIVGNNKLELNQDQGDAGIIFYVDDGGNVLACNLEVDGAFNHDGTTFGIFNTTPVTQRAHIADADNGVAAAAGDPPTQAEFNALVTAYNDAAGKFNTLLTYLEAAATGIGLLAAA